MKVGFDVETTLYYKILKNAKDKDRSLAAEIRYQLKKCYRECTRK